MPNTSYHVHNKRNNKKYTNKFSNTSLNFQCFKYLFYSSRELQKSKKPHYSNQSVEARKLCKFTHLFVFHFRHFTSIKLSEHELFFGRYEKAYNMFEWKTGHKVNCKPAFKIINSNIWKPIFNFSSTLIICKKELNKKVKSKHNIYTVIKCIEKWCMLRIKANLKRNVNCCVN